MRKPLPTATAYTIAREGGIRYIQRGCNIYRETGGVPRHYCYAPLWERSHAARRIRGEFGKPHKVIERDYDGIDW